MTFGREMLGATKRELPNRHKGLFHFTYDQGAIYSTDVDTMA